MLKEVSIEIIRKCPNNCIHCSSFSNMKCEEIIDLGTITQTIEDAKKLGAKTICLSGGEPFLHPDIVDIISVISDFGLECYIYTSGIIAHNNKHCELSIETLYPIKNKVRKLIFNIEAACGDTYNKIMRTSECFELLKQSVVNAISLSIVTEAHFVPMKLNINEIYDTILLCEKLGISKISFLRLVIHGRAFENEEILRLSESESKYLKKILSDVSKTSNLSIRLGIPFSDSSENSKCEAANGKINIKYDGSVFPCEVFKNDRVNFKENGLRAENIKQNRLYDIYKNSEYLKFVRNYVETYSYGSNCENCVGQYLIENNKKERKGNGK